MSREIKFRAWDADSKMMFAAESGYWDQKSRSSHSASGLLSLNFVQLSREGEDPNVDIEDLTWLQSTGLKDKNGVEIYEGDIVAYRKDIRQITFGVGGEGEPADYVGAYVGWCVGEDIDETNGFTQYEAVEMEVIGNIYQNPELLTAKE